MSFIVEVSKDVAHVGSLGVADTKLSGDIAEVTGGDGNAIG